MSEVSTAEDEESLLSFLRKQDVFKGVSPDAIRHLLTAASRRRVKAGEYIFQQDQRASTLVVFIKGLAVQFKRTGGLECLIRFYSDLALLGESGFIKDSRRSTSLYANDDCLIAEIDGSQLHYFAQSFPEDTHVLTANLGREVGRKISTIDEKLQSADQAALIRDSWVNWNRFD